MTSGNTERSESKEELDRFERDLRLRRRLGFGIPCTVVGGVGMVFTAALLFMGSGSTAWSWIAVIGGFSVFMLGYGLKTLLQGEVDDTDSILFDPDSDQQLLEDETAMWSCPDCEEENSNRTTTCGKCGYSLI